MRTTGLIALALVTACSAGGGNTDGGAGDAGSRTKIVHVNGGLAVDGGDVVGGVQFDPTELAWRCLPTSWKATEQCSNGQPAQPGPVLLSDGGVCVNEADGGTFEYPPCLAGDKFNVEDAIRALAKLTPLKTVPLSAKGEFDAPGVDVTNTTLALVGTVEDPSGLLVFSGYGLGKPPFDENCDSRTPKETGSCTLGKPVYVVSKAFLTYIAGQIGQEYEPMLAQGVVFIHVTDKDKKTGIAGAKIHHVFGSGAQKTTPEVVSDEKEQSYIYYIKENGFYRADSANDPLAVTGPSGLVVRLNAGSAKTYTAIKAGTQFEERLSGSRTGTALQMFFAECAPASEGRLQEGCPR